MNIPDCPLPTQPNDCITLAHGGGGRMTGRLIETLFYPAFANRWLEQAHDGATLTIASPRIAFTTDSFVVSPLFFPGGNIGDLAVNGTVNDLLCCGATPLYLSAAFILEEGLPLDTLRQVVEAMRQAALRAGVSIVTGDTKVVEHGKCDGLYINTSGIGVVPGNIEIGLHRVKKGDAVIVTGPIGNHGVSILSMREGLGFETTIESDTAALTHIVSNLLAGVPDVHMLRDPTRGGLSSTLNEIAEGAGVTITLDEEALPIDPSVRAACDLLGLDPLYVANEGILLVFLPDEYSEQALHLIRNDLHGKEARLIGHVTDDQRPEVLLQLALGQTRVLDMLSGEQLPRIC